MEIFKLVGSIMVDSAEAQKSISQTGTKAEGLASKLGSGIRTAGKWAAGITAAAVAVGGAMISAAKGTAASLDVIDKGSIRMGLSAERYQELAYAAGLCGVEMSTLESAAKKLEGTGIPFEGALESIMDISDETMRTNAAIELFGESIAYKLGPLLQAGGDGLKEMTAEAHALGLVVDDETVSAGAAMNDQFSKISQTFTAIKTSIITDLMPYLSKILDWVIKRMPQIRETISRTVDTIMPIVTPILDFLMETLPVVFDLAVGLLEKITPYVETAVEAISGLFSGLHGLLTGDMQEFKEGLATFFSDLASMALSAGSEIITALYNGMVAAFAPLSDWLYNALGSLGLYDNVSTKYATQTEGYMGSYYAGKYAQQFAHASGLAYVPYDGYNARLHRGETVLNSNDAAKLSSMLNSGGMGDGTPINLTAQVVLDGRVIGEASYNYIKRKDKAVGQ